MKDFLKLFRSIPSKRVCENGPVELPPPGLSFQTIRSPETGYCVSLPLQDRDVKSLQTLFPNNCSLDELWIPEECVKFRNVEFPRRVQEDVKSTLIKSLGYRVPSEDCSLKFQGVRILFPSTSPGQSVQRVKLVSSSEELVLASTFIQVSSFLPS